MLLLSSLMLLLSQLMLLLSPPVLLLSPLTWFIMMCLYVTLYVGFNGCVGYLARVDNCTNNIYSTLTINR